MVITRSGIETNTLININGENLNEEIMDRIEIRMPNYLKLEGNVAENWRVFKQNYNIFEQAADLSTKTEKQKIAIFLNACGPDTVEIFNNLEILEENRLNYKSVVQEIENYCMPKKN